MSNKVVNVQADKVLSAKVLTATLALAFVPLLAGAQTAAGSTRTASQDLRVGSLRTLDSSGVVTDSGMRTYSATTPVPSTIAKDYRLGPNDLLEVEVLDAENLRRTVRVNAAGVVSLPLIGRVSVAGLSSQEAEERIAARYAEKFLQNPQVSIFIKEFTSERITVEGAVGHPGIFPLSGQMTLLRALALAGGFGPIAKTSEVMLYRLNEQQVRESHVYDVEKIRAGQADDPVVKGDDLIVVQRDGVRAVLKDSLFRDVIDSVNPFSVLVPR